MFHCWLVWSKTRSEILLQMNDMYGESAAVSDTYRSTMARLAVSARVMCGVNGRVRGERRSLMAINAQSDNSLKSELVSTRAKKTDSSLSNLPKPLTVILKGRVSFRVDCIRNSRLSSVCVVSNGETSVIWSGTRCFHGGRLCFF